MRLMEEWVPIEEETINRTTVTQEQRELFQSNSKFKSLIFVEAGQEFEVFKQKCLVLVRFR